MVSRVRQLDHAPIDGGDLGMARIVVAVRTAVVASIGGLLLVGPGVMRAGQVVLVGGAPEGVVTSGGFGPTLGRSIGLARVSSAASGPVEVEIRGRRVPARRVVPPFVRFGKPLV